MISTSRDERDGRLMRTSVETHLRAPLSRELGARATRCFEGVT
jgi:hypothetical protein